MTVTSRTPVAEGRAFNAAGSYEQLTGRIEFALDPDDPHNRGIAIVLVDVLFEVANRGGKGGMLNTFNRGATRCYVPWLESKHGRFMPSENAGNAPSSKR